MKALILFGFAFFLSLAFIDFKKSYFLKKFNTIIKGEIVGIKSLENGVFFEIEYFANNTKNIYLHRFSSHKLNTDKLNILITKFIEKPFYLFAQKENDTIVAVTPYSRANITKWIYISFTFIMGYFLFSI